MYVNTLRRPLTVALLVCVLASGAPAEERSGETVTFSPKRYMEHLKYLASDDLAGRGTGSDGIDRAAEYIVKQFEAAGLQPAGTDGSWYQPFDVTRGRELRPDAAKLELTGNKKLSWKLDDDWRPFPFSESGEIEGPVAFAGYGIKAEDFEYNDYDSFDAEGKILLILRFEPQSDDPEAEFGGEASSRHALFIRKARVARKQGAKALLIVNPPGRDPDKDELYPFNEQMARRDYGLPMAHVKRDVANALLKKGGLPSLADLEAQLKPGAPNASQDLEGVTLTMAAGLHEKTIKAKNVIGRLEGTGDTDEVVVVGAHYDHLGARGEDDDRVIFNGADDNASGTTGLIELAAAFGRHPPRRDLVFMAFSAEELGLIGSRHFTNEPTFPLGTIKAMINMDMIGRYDEGRLEIYGVNTAKEFEALVEAAAANMDLDYRVGKSDIFGRSDHASFHRKQIPVLFPFTGLHKQYHRPGDDWNLINEEGAAKVVQLTYRLIKAVAEMETGPIFTSDDESDDAVAKAEEEGEDAPGKRASKSPTRPQLPTVRLGVMPAFGRSADRPGLLIETILEGGPADEAGMQEGDVIIKIGTQEVTDVSSYMEAMIAYKPGHVAEVVVVRAGKERTLTVKLVGSASTEQAEAETEGDG